MPPSSPNRPETAAEAQQRLEAGNAAYAAGRPAAPAPVQKPFAAVLGCADARAPLEMIFDCAANELFVVRVAGNVLDEAGLGSIDFAVANLPSLRLLAIVGHTDCGAVTAAVNAFLTPGALLDLAANRPLHAVVTAILPAVRAADAALQRVHAPGRPAQPGYRAALVDVAIVLNAAFVAATLQRAYPAVQVVYGINDLAGHVVGVPGTDASGGAVWQAGLVPPPADVDAYDALALALARDRLGRG